MIRSHAPLVLVVKFISLQLNLKWELLLSREMDCDFLIFITST